MSDVMQFLDRGGPALWVIAGLSVVLLALILWKIADLRAAGAWGTAGVRARIGEAARRALALGDDALAREETTRAARRELERLRAGLRAFELIATAAPLVGLLGTVLGMIEAFQALEAAGARPDAAVLAGGIWQALLTTAAGMGVAIPAAVALAAFEGVADRVQADLEDIATGVFVAARRDGEGAA